MTWVEANKISENWQILQSNVQDIHIWYSSFESPSEALIWEQVQGKIRSETCGIYRIFLESDRFISGVIEIKHERSRQRCPFFCAFIQGEQSSLWCMIISSFYLPYQQSGQRSFAFLFISYATESVSKRLRLRVRRSAMERKENDLIPLWKVK